MKKFIKKFRKFMKRNRKAILEYVQLGYLLAFMLLMFTGKTGAIISACAFCAMIVYANSVPSKK